MKLRVLLLISDYIYKMNSPKTRLASAFTLVELLVCIVIISVLAGILIPTLGKVRLKADQSKGLANMRQIATGIVLYCGDNDQTLPGPLWVGQGATYNKNDPKTLMSRIANYLGYPEAKDFGQIADVAIPPPYKRLKSPSGICFATPISYIQEGGGERFANPFGYQGNDGIVTAQPMKLSALASSGNLSKSWALQDIDQKMTGYKDAGWYSSLPKDPLYGNARNAVFFDMHAGTIPVQ